MLRLARMFLSLGGAQVAAVRDQAARRIVYFALVGLFGLLFLVFGLAAGTVALAERFGLLAALAIMAGGALFLCVFVLVLSNLADRRARALAAERAELQRRVRQLAMLSALGATRPKATHLVGLGVIAAAVMLVLGHLGGNDPNENS